MMNVQNLVNTLKTSYENGYRFFGVRNISTQMYKLNVGDTCPNSYDWGSDENEIVLEDASVLAIIE